MGYKKRDSKKPAPRMEDTDLKAFVKDWLAGRIFSSAHLREGERDKLHHVFMPLAFGALEHFAAKTIGLLWVNVATDRRMPMAINGLPMFATVRDAQRRSERDPYTIWIHMEGWRRRAVQ